MTPAPTPRTRRSTSGANPHGCLARARQKTAQNLLRNHRALAAGAFGQDRAVGVSTQSQAIAQRLSQVDLACLRPSSQTALIAECSVDEMRASCLDWSSVSLMAWAMI